MLFVAAVNDQFQKEVQEYVNNFQMISQWISNVPIVLFSIIAGALSDEFGRKPLMIFPMIGDLIGTLFNIINYAFIDTLPLEFFYTGNIGSFFGGYAVYYLGVYSYGTTITNPKERAYRLSRLDGMETIATVVGTLLSPVIFKQLGYYGSYSMGWLFSALAVIYMVFIVKEPLLKIEEMNIKSIPEKCGQEENKQVFFTGHIVVACSTLINFLEKAILIPIRGIKDVITKDRKLILKGLIVVQFVCFATYWLTYQIWNLMYLYMLLVFDGFNETDYSHFNVAMYLLNTFCLVVVMPIFSGKLKIHDSMLLFIILICEVVSSFITAFVTKLWQFYLAQGLGAIGYCKYSLVRSLMAQCIDSNEVGKVFSLLSIMSSLAPIGGNPLFRQLYNKTLTDFPGAIFLLYGSILFFSAAGNLFLYFMRKNIKCEKKVDIEETNAEIEDSVATESTSVM